MTTLIINLISLILTIGRAHDVGKNEWNILVPIYGIVLLFRPSRPTDNRWGLAPIRPQAQA